MFVIQPSPASLVPGAAPAPAKPVCSDRVERSLAIPIPSPRGASARPRPEGVTCRKQYGSLLGVADEGRPARSFRDDQRMSRRRSASGRPLRFGTGGVPNGNSRRLCAGATEDRVDADSSRHKTSGPACRDLTWKGPLAGNDFDSLVPRPGQRRGDGNGWWPMLDRPGGTGIGAGLVFIL